MTKKIQTKKGLSVGKVVAIGAGVAALGASAYYFLGPDSKKNQKKVAVWATDMKKEAEKKLAKVKDASQSMYEDVIDGITETYSKQYKQHRGDIEAFADHLKSEWNGSKKKASSVTKKVAKAVKKVAKSAPKKVVKKIITKVAKKAAKKK